MNNKGQVLVIFVILLPIILLILTFIVDYGLLSIEKRKIDSETLSAAEYYLENIDNVDVYNNTMKLLDNNLDDVEISILDVDDYINIIVKSNYKNLYNNIVNDDLIIKYRIDKINKEIKKG